MEAVSDTHLVAAAQAGDADAYGQLFARYEKRVYNYAYGITGNPEDAKDAAQEAFVRVFEALPRGKAVREFSAYLYRTAHNCAVDTAKGRARFAPPDAINLEIEPSVRADPERVALLKAQQEQTWQAAFTLSEKHRAVLALRELQEMSYQEIADVLDMPRNTVGVLLSRARLEFKEAFRMSSVDADTLAKECQDMLPLLSAYIDDELDEEERARVEEHVEECPLCALALEDMRAASKSYRGLVPLLPPVALGDEVLAAISKPAKTLAKDAKGAESVEAAGAGGVAGGKSALVGVAVLGGVALLAAAVVGAWLLGSWAGSVGYDAAELAAFESELEDSAGEDGDVEDGGSLGEAGPEGAKSPVTDRAADEEGGQPARDPEGAAAADMPQDDAAETADEQDAADDTGGTEPAAGEETADDAGSAPEAPEGMTIVEDTEPPPTPGPTSPANGASVSWSGVTLRWDAVEDESGVTYVVEIQRGASVGGGIVYSPLTIVDGLAGTSYTHRPVAPWERWRVWAMDGAGNASGKSAWRTYIVPIQ
jgi:RNA polymerase sigma-70 factor (ECF subfamily)